MQEDDDAKMGISYDRTCLGHAYQEFPTRTVTSGILFLSNAFLFGEHSKQYDLTVISLIVSPNRSLLFTVEVASVQLLQQRLDRL